MTNPIQVVKVEGIGDSLQKAVAPLIEAYQRRQQLEMEAERLKLEQQKIKLAEQQRLEEQAQLGQQGQALLQMVAAQDAQQTIMPELPNIQSPIGLGSAFFGQAEAGRPVTGFGPIAMAIRNTPVTAIPGVIEMSRDIRQSIMEQRAQRQADTALERTIQSFPKEQQDRLRQYVAMKRGGADLPVEAQRALFPEFFPDNVDPNVMNSAIRLGVTSGLTWGQVRSVFGGQVPKGLIPDEFRFPITIGSTKLSDKQMTASVHYQAMATAGPLLDRLIDQTGGLSIAAQLKRSFDVTQATSGGITGFLGNIGSMALQGVISSEQQQIVQAQFSWTNAYRYMVSGQQTSDKEFNVILNTVAESAFDKAEVKANKRAFRHAMQEAARRLASGERSPTQTADMLLQQAQTLGLSPELQRVLQQQRADAAAYEASGANAPPQFSSDPAQAQQAESRRLIFDMIFNK